MKNLSKLKLNNLSQNEIRKAEQKMVFGGDYTLPEVVVYAKYCHCLYAGAQEGPNDSYYGGSSKHDNSQANN